MGVSKDIGIIHYNSQNSAFNGTSFALFINELIDKINELHLQQVCFVMDNVRLHKTEVSIEDQCQKNNIELEGIRLFKINVFF